MSKQRLMTFLMQWLIQHGTNHIEQYQMGVFEMDSYYKCIRLKYLKAYYDREATKQCVYLTDVGIKYIEENTK